MKKNTLFLLLLLSTITYSQIVTNGNFQTGDEAPWTGNAANVVDLGGLNWVNQAQVLAAGTPFSVNLSQDIALTDGLTYQLSFDAFT
jgi:endoglucanase